MGSEFEYGAGIPCSEEILQRCILEEERLAKSAVSRERAVADRLAWYRKSNRIALTWGWLVDRLFFPAEAEDDRLSAQAWHAVFRIIDEVLDGRKGSAESERELLGREMLILLENLDSRKRVRVLERVRDLCSFAGRALCGIPETGKIIRIDAVGNIGLWPIYIEWLELQRMNLKCREMARMVYYTLTAALAEAAIAGQIRMEYFLQRLMYLEKYAIGDEEWEHIYTQALAALWIDCLNAEDGRGKVKPDDTPEILADKSRKAAELLPVTAEACRRMMERGELLFHYFSIKYIDEILSRKPKRFLEVYGDDPAVDLADLELYFEEGKERYDDKRNYRILVWAAGHMRLTDRFEGPLSELSVFLACNSTEEELLFFREKGFFPERCLLDLIRYLRREDRERAKIPILLQWLYEGEW